MTISNQINRVQYTGNGTTTVFAFNATLFAAADLKVIVKVDSTEVETTQTLITDYTVALAGDFSTATITMVTAPAIGETLTFIREQDYLQSTDLINNDGVPADTVERMSDEGALMSQRLQEQVDRCLRLPESSAITEPELPDLVGKAGQIVRVGSDELGYTYVDIDLDVITNQQVTALQKDIYNKVIDITAAQSPYTVLVADEGAMHRVDTSTGAVTLNLPSMAAQVSGEDLKYSFVKQSGDANIVTIAADGSELISGASTRTISTRYAIIIVIGDQDNEEWFHVGTTQSLADINVDRFSGNASDVAFTLSVDPISENNTQVYIDGVYQQKDTYSVSGTTLTFSTAPPSGTDNIEVTHIETLAMGVPADLSVTTGKIATGAVTLEKMADLAQNRIIGRVTASTGVPEALTPANVMTVLGSALDIVNDTTPQLGGALDVNGKEILSISSTNVDLHSDADIVLEIGDTGGVNKVSIRDSAAAEVAAIDSNGNITVAGLVDGRDVASDGALAASALQDVVDDISPVLGGNLNVQDFAINSSGGSDVHVHSDADIPLELGDAAGVNKVLILDSASAEVAAIDSDGNITTSGTVDGRDVDADGTVLDALNARLESFVIAASDETTDLTAAAGKVQFIMPYAFTLTEVRTSVTTAPTDATLIVDINDGGTSIMTTDKLDILTTATVDDGTAALTDTALADKAVITIDIDQIGSTNAGKGLKVYLIGTQS